MSGLLRRYWCKAWRTAEHSSALPYGLANWLKSYRLKAWAAAADPAQLLWHLTLHHLPNAEFIIGQVQRPVHCLHGGPQKAPVHLKLSSVLVSTSAILRQTNMHMLLGFVEVQLCPESTYGLMWMIWRPAGSAHKGRLSDQASDFTKTFREEVKKGMDQQFGGKDGPDRRR